MNIKANQYFVMRMVFPSIIFLMMIGLFPIIYLFACSMTDAYLLRQGQEHFIGFANYVSILKDSYFIQALKNTLTFTFICVPIETFLGVILAIFISSFKHGQKVIRILVLLPMMLPQITVSLIWQIMLSNNGGIINTFIQNAGFTPVNWLMNVHTAFASIIFIDIWQYTPQTFLLAYAAMQAVPTSQYEAVEIDGAGILSKIMFVTLPNIKEEIFIVMLLRTIDTFRLFDKVNILTGGGPAGSTTTITQYIYNYGTKSFETGYASAASVIMTIMVLCISVFYLKKQLDNTCQEGQNKWTQKNTFIFLRKWKKQLELGQRSLQKEAILQN